MRFTFTQDGNGYTIADATGRYLWHEGSFKTISVSTDASNAATWTLTANADGTFKILTDAVYYIQYSTKFTSYGCYNSEQGLMPMLYERVERAAHRMPSRPSRAARRPPTDASSTFRVSMWVPTRAFSRTEFTSSTAGRLS